MKILKFDKKNRRRHALVIVFLIPYDEELQGFETRRKCNLNINGKIESVERFILYIKDQTFDVELDDESWVSISLSDAL